MQRSIGRTHAALAMVALIAAVVVVAAAARSPLSGSTPVNATAAQGPTIAVFTVFLGIGIVMLGVGAVLLWLDRRREDEPPEPEPTLFELPWYWKLFGLLLLTAFGAAFIVAAVLGTRSRRTMQPLPGLAIGLGPLRHARPTRTPGGFALPAWLPWTTLGIVVLALVAGAFVLWLRWKQPEAEGDDATTAALEAAIGALDADRDPRRAVIAAYGAMQRALGEHGVVPSPAEAPREYLRRVLLERGATEREATTLTGLFEEARYSTHPIPERARALALFALRSLRGRLHGEAAQ